MSASLLPRSFRIAARTYQPDVRGCHGLAPWRFTLAAKKQSHDVGGGHGLVPWRFTFDGKELARLIEHKAASVRLHGAGPWQLRVLSEFLVAGSVNYHGTRPWHPFSLLRVEGETEYRTFYESAAFCRTGHSLRHRRPLDPAETPRASISLSSGELYSVGLFENDVATLLHARHPPIEPLLTELALYLIDSDMTQVKQIASEIQHRISRFEELS